MRQGLKKVNYGQRKNNPDYLGSQRPHLADLRTAASAAQEARLEAERQAARLRGRAQGSAEPSSRRHPKILASQGRSLHPHSPHDEGRRWKNI